MGPQGVKGATGPQGVPGTPGVAGPEGPQGPAGPAASASTYVGEGPLTIVDQNGQEVGIATDLFSGFLVRRVGNDVIMFAASAAAGLPAEPIDFYHSTDDCSDSRYLPIPGGSGFAYFARVRGATLFYTKTLDPTGTVQVPIRAFEHFEPDADATQPGTCTRWDAGPASIGVVTAATDPALGKLALPLRLK